MTRSIDLNADIGEGFDDGGLLDVVTSASIACGFHAGDEQTMRRACVAAVERGVAIGAHVSYRDREGFGRRETGDDAATIAAGVAEQIAVLDEIAAGVGGRVMYVKPHGALYHRATGDAACAAAIVSAAAGLAVLGFPGSALLERAGDAGLAAVPEAFADRGYADDGTLIGRGEPGAVLDAEAAALQAVAIAQRRDGARSICVHSDTPGALDVARRVRDALERAGYDVRAFV
jgi:5-oxoprolinase (ATP-hydrolysing) subunit A